MALEAWICSSCNSRQKVDDAACTKCGKPRPKSIGKAKIRGGKFMDKRVNDLVRKATRSCRNKMKSENVLREVLSEPTIVNAAKKRRQTLLERQFKEKSDEILRLAHELESIRKSIGTATNELRENGDILLAASDISLLENTNSTSISVSNRTKEQKGDKYVCPECGISCSTRYNLKEHLVSHYGTHYICYVDECEYKAPSRYYLKRHLKNEHQCSKVFYCMSCPRTFESKADQTQHKQDKHQVIPASNNVDINTEISIIQSLTEDKGSSADNGDDDTAVDNNDDDWVPEEEVTVKEPIKRKPPRKRSKVKVKKAPVVREKVPRERKKCPHEGCGYTATLDYFIAHHRIRDHKEVISVPAQKRAREKKFTCEICGRKATSSWYIKRHMRKHTGEKPFACTHSGCEYKAFRKCHLIRHEINMHNPEIRLKCDLCSFVAYDKANLLAHKQYTHSMDNFNCVYCVYYAKGRDAIKSHIKRVHKFICDACEWEFVDEAAKAAHYALHTENGITCTICSRSLPNGKELLSHALSEHQVVIETRIPRKRLILPTCDICSYQFPNKPLLDTHVKQHEGTGIRCSVCEVVFPEMEELKAHTECEHGFGIDAFKKRIRHKGSSTFPCTVCGYEFKTEAEQQSHVERHRPDGSIRCEHCSFIGTTMSVMMDHYSDHHNITSTATPRKRKNHHVCDICKYLFYTEELVEQHKKFHLSDGSIQCEVCNVVFSKMKHLVDHMMLMHSLKLDATYQRVRPYLNTCPVCCYMFESKEKLNEHRARHLPDGSIICEFCEFQTGEMEVLKSHMIEVHGTILNSNRKRYKRKKGDPPRSPRRRSKNPRKVPTSLVANHTITDILDGQGIRTMDEPPELNLDSYISSCAYESAAASYRPAAAFDSRLSNHFITNNIFASTLQQSQLVNPSLIHEQASCLDIRQKIDLSKLIPGGLDSAPQPSSTPRKQESTVIPIRGKVKRPRKDKSNSENSSSKPKLKAFPGLFM